ncbi:MAG: hypothetical protein D3M94_18120 [Rhodocyclales bacterium GT-UBC]|nr:MAG: hypothetical protein D3M94_18120 [Rhodocyclales bacterium GT-UBC]
MSFRRFLIAMVASLAVAGAHAWEPTVNESASEESFVQGNASDALVTIAAVPMPPAVIELANYAPKLASSHQSKKVKAAKLARAKSMLSRSAREQIVLAASTAKPDEKARLSAFDDEEAETGLDDLDLHRSFSQPKLAKAQDLVDDEDDPDVDLPDHVKLRLLMARTRAVEVLAFNQAAKAAQADASPLSESVEQRLREARERAVAAHRAKFGAV